MVRASCTSLFRSESASSSAVPNPEGGERIGNLPSVIEGRSADNFVEDGMFSCRGVLSFEVLELCWASDVGDARESGLEVMSADVRRCSLLHQLFVFARAGHFVHRNLDGSHRSEAEFLDFKKPA